MAILIRVRLYTGQLGWPIPIHIVKKDLFKGFIVNEYMSFSCILC